MKKTTGLRASIAALALATAIDAHALSGEELFNYCAENACGGYFVGAFDGLRIAGAVGGQKMAKAALICAPDDISDEELVDVALAYLRDHASTRHLQAANLALRAWRERWPCAQK